MHRAFVPFPDPRLRATADPALDLAHPMRGPYRTSREGPADLHRLGIALAKQVGGTQFAVYSFIGDYQGLGRPGEQVDAKQRE